MSGSLRTVLLMKMPAGLPITCSCVRSDRPSQTPLLQTLSALRLRLCITSWPLSETASLHITISAQPASSPCQVESKASACAVRPLARTWNRAWTHAACLTIHGHTVQPVSSCTLCSFSAASFSVRTWPVRCRISASTGPTVPWLCGAACLKTVTRGNLLERTASTN